jgi:hypothetical protein
MYGEHKHAKHHEVGSRSTPGNVAYTPEESAGGAQRKEDKRV